MQLLKCRDFYGGGGVGGGMVKGQQQVQYKYLSEDETRGGSFGHNGREIERLKNWGEGFKPIGV